MPVVRLILFVCRLLDFSAFAFRKPFERGFCIISACIGSPTKRAGWLTAPLARDNRALITHAHSHDVVVLPELRVLGIYIPSATRLGTVFGFRPSGDLQQR